MTDEELLEALMAHAAEDPREARSALEGRLTGALEETRRRKGAQGAESFLRALITTEGPALARAAEDLLEALELEAYGEEPFASLDAALGEGPIAEVNRGALTPAGDTEGEDAVARDGGDIQLLYES